MNVNNKNVVDIDVVKNYYNEKIEEFKENGIITLRTVDKAIKAVKDKFSK
jgi:hypothetical protein